MIKDNLIEEFTECKDVHKDSIIHAMLTLMVKQTYGDSVDKSDAIYNVVKSIKKEDMEVYEALYQYCWDNISLILGD